VKNLFPKTKMNLTVVAYRFVDSFRGGRSWSFSKAVYRPVWHTPLLSVHWTNSWWWRDDCPKHVEFHDKYFVKLVHLVGFIAKKFVTMHGHMNVKW